jgi:hypothetical protein
MNPFFLQVVTDTAVDQNEQASEKTMSILELMSSGGIGGILIMIFLGVLSIIAV